MSPVSEAKDGINDSASVINGNNNLESGGNKFVSTGIISLVSMFDQINNTNTTHGTQGGEGEEGGMCPTTDTATSVHSLDNNDEFKDVGMERGMWGIMRRRVVVTLGGLIVCSVATLLVVGSRGGRVIKSTTMKSAIMKKRTMI